MKSGRQARALTRDHLKAEIANKSGIMAGLELVLDGVGLPKALSLTKASSSCDEGHIALQLSCSRFCTG